MLNRNRFRAFAIWTFAGVWLLSLVGCGLAPASADAAPQQMLLVDLKTGEAIVSPVVTQFPAKNPKTGQTTLMPGLYCPECRAWHATPPVDQVNRQPGAAKCAKTGALLTPHGPWPGEAGFQPQGGQP